MQVNGFPNPPKSRQNFHHPVSVKNFDSNGLFELQLMLKLLELLVFEAAGPYSL